MHPLSLSAVRWKKKGSISRSPLRAITRRGSSSENWQWDSQLLDHLTPMGSYQQEGTFLFIPTILTKWQMTTAGPVTAWLQQTFLFKTIQFLQTNVRLWTDAKVAVLTPLKHIQWWLTRLVGPTVYILYAGHFFSLINNSIVYIFISRLEAFNDLYASTGPYIKVKSNWPNFWVRVEKLIRYFSLLLVWWEKTHNPELVLLLGMLHNWFV